ncbi:MAG: MBL fold metallo-hydrolase [Actinobacteria bacterium]|jgi:glyoxylase-like metal-dependent hydrolase (beta-lactamase superfamily II)|nr:MBL fold metallo-hydrolase [Actinomycetota bacterium]
MSDRFVIGLPLGRWQTNCWIVGDRDLGTAVVVDPGEHGATEVPPLLERAGVTCAAILLTHGHLDHAWAVPDLARSLDVEVLLHAEDRWLWDDPAAAFGMPSELLEQQFGLRWDPPTERLRDLTDGQRLAYAGVEFDVRHNPGHTPGHVTFLGRRLAGVPVTFAMGDAESASEDVLFSGDLVFAGSIGRTDFPRGSTEHMMRSLVDTVLPLDDTTLILSGHGPDTTIGHERVSNPFLREAARHGA